jgi:rare lipoprotein A
MLAAPGFTKMRAAATAKRGVVGDGFARHARHHVQETGFAPWFKFAPRSLALGGPTGAALMLAACTNAAVEAWQTQVESPHAIARPAPATEGTTGLASYYHHEARIADALTAAHRTLPFGTRVRVTNLSNNRVVTVQITDRGPFIADRVIDLSYEAAAAIGMTDSGLARVRLDVVP